MPDLFEWFLIASGLTAIFGGTAGGVAAIRHMQGWLPKAYLARLEGIQTNAARQIGVEVYGAMVKLATEQRAEMEKEVTEGQVHSQLLNAAKNLKFNAREVDSAMAQAILGPALPILRQFAPTMAEMLEENPQLVGVVIEHPLFKKYIEPRLAAFLGSKSEPSSENPFLKGMSP